MRTRTAIDSVLGYARMDRFERVTFFAGPGRGVRNGNADEEDQARNDQAEGRYWSQRFHGSNPFQRECFPGSVRRLREGPLNRHIRIVVCRQALNKTFRWTRPTLALFALARLFFLVPRLLPVVSIIPVVTICARAFPVACLSRRSDHAIVLVFHGNPHHDSAPATLHRRPSAPQLLALDHQGLRPPPPRAGTLLQPVPRATQRRPHPSLSRVPAPRQTGRMVFL